MSGDVLVWVTELRLALELQSLFTGGMKLCDFTEILLSAGRKSFQCTVN